MSMSSFFIKKTAVKILIPESIVELVVKDQFKQLHEAIKSHKHFDHEISGFGRLQLSRVKLNSFLNKYSHLLLKLVEKRKALLENSRQGNLVATEGRIRSLMQNLQSLMEIIPVFENKFDKEVDWRSKWKYEKALEINQELPDL